MPIKIAIVGAGASGLSQLHAFESAKRAGETELPEIVCFEKQSDWGGLWRYNWQTGLDSNGEAVHGSMYRNLWTNIPKEIIEYPDYSYDEHFGRAIPSYVSREVEYDYITGRAKKSDIRKYIQFDTIVRWVSYSKDNKKFTVVVKNHKTDQMVTSDYDYLIIATGHFSTPDIPYFNGIEMFPGRVLHSHDFRDAREFTGKKVLVVGGKYSAEDIALQCYKYGAKSVTISYRTRPMDLPWPKSIKEVPILTKVDGRKVHFKDGTTEEVDTIILCTGYLHHFPFLADNLRLRANNRLYPPGLYKGLFVPTLPNLIYVGMQNEFFSFHLFDAQAWFVRDVILGKIKLVTDVHVMEADIAAWVKREDNFVDPFDEGIDFQLDYIEELVNATKYPQFDLRKVGNYLREWHQHKKMNILTFRNIPFVSAVTGAKASVHPTPWIDEMDDSKEVFIGKGSKPLNDSTTLKQQ